METQAHGLTTQVQADFAAYLAGHPEATLASVSNAINVSRATLSTWKAGTYNGDNERITEAVRGFLETARGRADRPAIGTEYRETTIGRTVLDVCRFAHHNQDIGLVYGAAGVGKTMGLREYKRQHQGEVIYLRCDPSCSAPQALVERILMETSKDCNGFRLSPLLQRVYRELAGSGRLLILDEAQYLSYRSLETVRGIHDMTEIGIVLCGNDEVYTRIRGEGRAVFAQLFSRVGIRRHVSLSATRDDVAAIAGDLPTESLKFLSARARQNGGLRMAVKLLKMAMEMTEGRAPTVEDLQMAETQLVSGC